jgi:hypothetical protein
MTVSWLAPAKRLAGLAAGWEGLWCLLVTARRAALAPWRCCPAWTTT